MLKNNDIASPSIPLSVHGFLVGVELVNGEPAHVNYVGDKLIDALKFVEGVGNVELEYLGEIECVDDDEAMALSVEKES